ncbi:hypothetical protein CRG98_011559 [Punica granatum]|uniref:Uncharacterized protein n=1 Tax=Punica granatum TaxID=22663 RepID=A0A2I0KIG2_PUNGR|nr:hypothetical protein CRG98_011559 [Punica granatum]
MEPVWVTSLFPIKKTLVARALSVDDLPTLPDDTHVDVLLSFLRDGILIDVVTVVLLMAPWSAVVLPGLMVDSLVGMLAGLVVSSVFIGRFLASFVVGSGCMADSPLAVHRRSLRRRCAPIALVYLPPLCVKERGGDRGAWWANLSHHHLWLGHQDSKNKYEMVVDYVLHDERGRNIWATGAQHWPPTLMAVGEVVCSLLGP